MLKGSENGSIGILLMNVSNYEGKFYGGTQQEDFLRCIYNGTDFTPPNIQDVMNGPTINWRELKTGDAAVYLGGGYVIIGVVIGEIERQLCYVDPIESIIKIVDYDEYISDYKYYNGAIIIRNK